MADTTNAALAAQVTSVLARLQGWQDELANWLSGAPDGGPNGDGRFPLTNAVGASSLYLSLPAVTDMVSGPAAASEASRVAAEAAATNADNHRLNAVTAKNAAEAARDLAQTSRDEAEVFRNGAAADWANVQTYRAQVATDLATTEGARDETLTARDEAAASATAAAASEADAEAHAAAAAAYDVTDNLGVANGIATLNSAAQIPFSQIPAISLIDVYVRGSEDEMLGLVAQQGDVCVRSDIHKSYMRNTGTTGTVADWTLLQTPDAAVLSVDGRIGAIDLSDRYAPLSHIHTIADVTGLSLALDSKLTVEDASADWGTGAVRFVNGAFVFGNTSTEQSILFRKGGASWGALVELDTIGWGGGAWWQLPTSGTGRAFFGHYGTISGFEFQTAPYVGSSQLLTEATGLKLTGGSVSGNLSVSGTLNFGPQSGAGADAIVSHHTTNYYHWNTWYQHRSGSPVVQAGLLVGDGEMRWDANLHHWRKLDGTELLSVDSGGQLAFSGGLTNLGPQSGAAADTLLYLNNTNYYSNIVFRSTVGNSGPLTAYGQILTSPSLGLYYDFEALQIRSYATGVAYVAASPSLVDITSATFQFSSGGSPKFKVTSSGVDIWNKVSLWNGTDGLDLATGNAYLHARIIRNPASDQILYLGYGQTGAVQLYNGTTLIAQATAGGFDVTGVVTATGRADFRSPNGETTGAVRLRANTDATPKAFMQVTDNGATAQWGYWEFGSGGNANWNGSAGLFDNGGRALSWNGTRAGGKCTISTAAPSGGSDGDVWFKV